MALTIIAAGSDSKITPRVAMVHREFVRARGGSAFDDGVMKMTGFSRLLERRWLPLTDTFRTFALFPSSRNLRLIVRFNAMCRDAAYDLFGGGVAIILKEMIYPTGSRNKGTAISLANYLKE